MDLNRSFKISANVRSRALGSEAVLLDLTSSTYFGLDAVGARMWQLLEHGKSIAEVRDVIISEFDVSRDVLEQDLLDLVRDLQEKQLIS